MYVFYSIYTRFYFVFYHIDESNKTKRIERPEDKNNRIQYNQCFTICQFGQKQFPRDTKMQIKTM